MSVLEVRGLAKHYTISGNSTLFTKASQHRVPAVMGVDFEVERGEVLTIVGESGCGKSTIAKMLVGLTPQSAGTITVDGHELRANRTREDRLRIQLVGQNPWAALNRRHTIEHALEQPLRVNGLGGGGASRRAMVEAMVERVGLTRAHLDARPSDVSGGELARAVLARALLLEPQVLVLDEPTASLDASVKATVVNLLLQLRKDLDLSMVLITHEIGVARVVADQAAVMYLGNFVEIGPASGVLHTPRHPYSSMLLASVPIADPTHKALVPGRGEVPSAMAVPSGCAYHPRCDMRDADCMTQVPEAVTLEDRRVVCHRVTDLGFPGLAPPPLDKGEPTRPPSQQPDPAVPNSKESSCPSTDLHQIPSNS